MESIKKEELGQFSRDALRDECVARGLKVSGNLKEDYIAVILGNNLDNYASELNQREEEFRELQETPALDRNTLLREMDERVENKLDSFMEKLTNMFGQRAFTETEARESVSDGEVDVTRQLLHTQNEALKVLLKKATESANVGVPSQTYPELVNSVPHFYGKYGDEVKPFLDSLENVRLLHNWPSEVTIRIAKSKLKGVALDWQRTKEIADIKDYHAWLVQFKKRFKRELTLQEWTGKVEARLQQPGEHIADYMLSKMSLIDRRPKGTTISLESINKYLITGVRSEVTKQQLRGYFLHSKCKTSDLIDYATEIEADKVLKASVRPSELGVVKQSSDNITANKCNEVGETSAVAAASQKDDVKRQDRRGSGPRCYRCRSWSHLLKDCPEPDTRTPEQIELARQKREKNLKIREAYANQQKVQDTGKLPKISLCVIESEHTSRAMISMKVEDVSVVALRDGGADISVLRREEVELAGLKIERKTPLEVEVFQRRATITHFVTANISTDKYSCCLQNIPVMNNMGCALLLGNDWVDACQLNVGRVVKNGKLYSVFEHRNDSRMGDLVPDVPQINTLFLEMANENAHEEIPQVGWLQTEDNASTGNWLQSQLETGFFTLDEIPDKQQPYIEVLDFTGRFAENWPTAQELHGISIRQLEVIENNNSINPELEHKIDNMQISHEVSPQQQKRMRDILKENRAMFATFKTDIGVCPKTLHHIKLNTDAIVRIPPYRHNFQEEQFIEQQIDEWLKAGIIRVSYSPYSSPCIVVHQPLHESTPIRICLDFRKINAATERPFYPMPVIEAILQRFFGKEWMSDLDIKKAFLNILINPEHCKYTAFSSSSGHYEFVFMPFGLTGAPATMQSTVDEAIAEGKRKGDATAYIDNIAFHTEGIDRHLDALSLGLGQLRTYGFKFEFDRCHFLVKEIKFLGYIITATGKTPDPARTAVIDRYKSLRTWKEVRSFLGFTGHFRKYIRDYAKISKPLQDLVKRSTPFCWTKECDEAVEQLKVKIKSPPILAHFDPNLKTRVDTDASQVALGAALLQQASDKGWRIIELASRKLAKDEEKLHSTELEGAAVHWALAICFRGFLSVLPTFEVWTDNWSVSLMSAKVHISRKFARYMLDLQEFRFTVHHRKGESNVLADALSRPPESAMCMAILLAGESRLEEFQKKDPYVAEIYRALKVPAVTKSDKSVHDQFGIEDGIVVRQEPRAIVLPKRMRQEALEICHDKAGHLGPWKTERVMACRYWWPDWKKDVKSYCSSCLVCQQANPYTGPPIGQMVARKIPDKPFATISADHIGPITVNHGCQHILVFVDHATRYIIACPVQTTSAINFQESMRREILDRYGPPYDLITDRGSAFTCKRSLAFYRRHDIAHHPTVAYWPQGNGMCERANSNIIRQLRKFGEGSKKWVEGLPQQVFKINMAAHEGTKFSPFYLLHLYEPRREGEFSLGRLEDSDEDIVSREQVARGERMQARWNLESQNAVMKKRYDKGKRPSDLEVRDWVWWRDPNPKKFGMKWLGPYEIVELLASNCVKLRRIHPEGRKRDVRDAHVRQLKKYYEPMVFPIPEGSSSEDSPWEELPAVNDATPPGTRRNPRRKCRGDLRD